jgi:hypothetical protein
MSMTITFNLRPGVHPALKKSTEDGGIALIDRDESRYRVNLSQADKDALGLEGAATIDIQFAGNAWVDPTPVIP